MTTEGGGLAYSPYENMRKTVQEMERACAEIFTTHWKQAAGAATQAFEINAKVAHAELTMLRAQRDRAIEERDAAIKARDKAIEQRELWAVACRNAQKAASVAEMAATEAEDDARRYQWMKRHAKRIPAGWWISGWDVAIDKELECEGIDKELWGSR